ncbi:MAG: tRNA (adenosine(37)-N6)-dimethylallyltransferase MiaA [Planctomycetota bacterium]|jgi:tRNA dimethylallyltransferase
MSRPPLLDCWYLTGPTAGGKTAVGVALAGRIDAEVVSLDSMALYRGMDVGTAKPSPEDRRAVPHHLIDVIDPHEQHSLAQYVDMACRASDEIRGRGRHVLFVGGTPLYLKGLLRGIFQGPPADWEFRERLEKEAGREEPGFLHRRLAEVDPTAAERLHPNDTRRLIRALEVFEKTGRPISEWQGQFDVGHQPETCRVFVLHWPRGELHRRIDRRVDRMIAAGLVDEVRALLEGPRPLSRTAAQGVGYREVIEHLTGKRDLAETIERIKAHTRRFARRQLTWFRSLGECRFVPVDEPLDPAAVAGQIAQDGRVTLPAARGGSGRRRSS